MYFCESKPISARNDISGVIYSASTGLHCSMESRYNLVLGHYRYRLVSGIAAFRKVAATADEEITDGSQDDHPGEHQIHRAVTGGRNQGAKGHGSQTDTDIGQ